YCTDPKAPGICVDLPNGIRFVTGYNMKTMSGGPNDTRPYQWDSNFMGFDCYGSEDGTVPGIAGEYHTINAVADAGCPVVANRQSDLDDPLHQRSIVLFRRGLGGRDSHYRRQRTLSTRLASSDGGRSDAVMEAMLRQIGRPTPGGSVPELQT